MLYYNRIVLSEGIDVTKSNNRKECIISHYWFFNHGFKFQESVCNCCKDLGMLCLNISDIVIITVKVLITIVLFTLENLKPFIHWTILYLMIVRICKMHTKKINIKNQVHYHYESLSKPKRNILINKKSYKDLVIYFTRCHPNKSILSL